MKRILSTFVFFCVALSATQSSAWFKFDYSSYQPVGVDLTADYQRLLNEKNSPARDLKPYKVILVEGIMANYVDALGNFILKKFGEYQYFDDQLLWLKREGVEVEKLKLETENSSLKNSYTIEEAIERSTKPVLLITHSKGGLDAIHAFLRRPELTERVRAMLSLQSPYLGTPVADYLLRTQPWKGLAFFILKLMGGSGESLVDLGTDRRVEWMEQNTPGIYEIQRRLPILSYASWKKNVPKKIDSMFELPRNLLEKNLKIESDGMVPWKSAVLPYGYYVAHEGLDHATPVSNNRYIKLDRVKFTQTLLHLLLDLKPLP